MCVFVFQELRRLVFIIYVNYNSIRTYSSLSINSTITSNLVAELNVSSKTIVVVRRTYIPTTQEMCVRARCFFLCIEAPICLVYATFGCSLPFISITVHMSQRQIYLYVLYLYINIYK